MRRRTFTFAVCTALAGLAGCAETETSGQGEDGGSSGSQPTETDAATERTTQTEAQTDTPSPTPEETETSKEGSYQVRVRYDGDWQGTISAGESTKSIDGSGERTFDVTGDPLIVSANAQKQDASDKQLTVQILQGGSVIAETSTTSEYGLAQVTSGDEGSLGGGSDSTATSGSAFAIKIIYEGAWQGSITTGGSSRTIAGEGTRTVEIDGSPDIISANALKQDDSSRELTVQILKNGDVVAETSTTASYGVAQVSETNY